MATTSPALRSYFKTCRTCARRISMWQLPVGRWEAHNPDGSPHYCRAANVSLAPVPKKRPTTSARHQVTRPPASRIHATAEQIFLKVQTPRVQQHEFVVRAVIHWGPNQLKCLTAIRPIDEPGDGALCDPRHAIFFGKNDSLDQIYSRLERWFDEHPDGWLNPMII